MSYLIECKNLTAGYEGMPVVKDLSFNVSAGDYLCIVGENGSGKSTLMKTILGLRSPLSGEIIFGDGLKQTEIGYLPQQTAAQKDFPATVREVVLSGCLGRKGLSPFYSKADKKLCDDNIELLGITGITHRSYAICRAVSNSVYCLPVRFVRQENCFSSMSLFPDLTLWLPLKCMR